jgi:hypothetical protein
MFAKLFPVASTLLGTTWRISAIGGLAAIAAATKWPNTNLFCLCLVGYYFPFVTLESWLAIQNLTLSRDAS